jgi:YcxB-like protein
MSVSATYEYEPAEHYRALRTITNLTPFRWMIPVCVGLPVVLFGLLLWAAWARGDSLASTAWEVSPYVALILFWALIIPISQRRRAKRLPTLDASVQGPQERRVDADGYHSRGNGVGVDVPWHALKKVVETDQFFMFFYNWQCGYYLPKRTLGPSEVAEVRQLVQVGMGDRARLLG